MAWSGRVWAASERSAQRWVRSVASATTVRGELGKTGWSKATATSEPSASWTPMATSGREPVERAVDVAAERDAVLVDDPQVAERDHLEPARVGQDRPVPAHEPVQAAELRDPFVAGPQVEVVGVRQDDRGADLADVVGREGLDRRVGPDRHELRRLDDAVGQRQPPGPCPGRAVRGRRRRDLVAGRLPDVWGCHASGVSGGSTTAGRSHRPGIPGSVRRGGGIS